MVMRICIMCGQLFEGKGSRCADHTNRWHSGSTREWRNARERTLARNGYRCTVDVRPGERCEGTSLVEIHHSDGSDCDVLLIPDEELASVCRASTTCVAALPQAFRLCPDFL